MYLNTNNIQYTFFIVLDNYIIDAELTKKYSQYITVSRFIKNCFLFGFSADYFLYNLYDFYSIGGINYSIFIDNFLIKHYKNTYHNIGISGNFHGCIADTIDYILKTKFIISGFYYCYEVNRLNFYSGFEVIHFFSFFGALQYSFFVKNTLVYRFMLFNSEDNHYILEACNSWNDFLRYMFMNELIREELPIDEMTTQQRKGLLYEFMCGINLIM